MPAYCTLSVPKEGVPLAAQYATPAAAQLSAVSATAAVLTMLRRVLACARPPTGSESRERPRAFPQPEQYRACSCIHLPQCRHEHAFEQGAAKVFSASAMASQLKSSTSLRRIAVRVPSFRTTSYFSALYHPP